MSPDRLFYLPHSSYELPTNCLCSRGTTYLFHLNGQRFFFGTAFTNIPSHLLVFTFVLKTKSPVGQYRSFTQTYIITPLTGIWLLGIYRTSSEASESIRRLNTLFWGNEMVEWSSAKLSNRCCPRIE